MAKTNNNRLPYGLIILIIGFIYLLSKAGILQHIPYADKVMNAGMFFLVAGIIFLVTKAEKTMGLIFTAIGVIMNFDLLFGWMHNYSSFVLPVLLIGVGLTMELTSKK